MLIQYKNNQATNKNRRKFLVCASSFGVISVLSLSGIKLSTQTVEASPFEQAVKFKPYLWAL